MNIQFLQTLPLTGISGNPTGGLLGISVRVFIGIFIVFIILFALYLYLSIVYSKIGKKAGLSSPGIAWMPYGGFLAVIFESSKMHWWPFLMLVIGLLLGYILIISSFIIGSAMNIISSLVLLATTAIFLIMSIIWHWKTYEAVRKPGWWVLVPVIAGILGFALALIGGSYGKVSVVFFLGVIIVILGLIAHLILVGIAAWSKNSGKR